MSHFQLQFYVNYGFLPLRSYFCCLGHNFYKITLTKVIVEIREYSDIAPVNQNDHLMLSFNPNVF